MDTYHVIASIIGLAGIPVSLAGEYMFAKSYAIQHAVSMRVGSAISTCGAAMFLLGIASFFLAVVMSPLANNN